MSLNTVTSGLKKPPKIQSPSIAKDVQQQPDLKETTENLTHPLLPGEFPPDEPKDKDQQEQTVSISTAFSQWSHSLLPNTLNLESSLKRPNDLAPPPAPPNSRIRSNALPSLRLNHHLPASLLRGAAAYLPGGTVCVRGCCDSAVGCFVAGCARAGAVGD